MAKTKISEFSTTAGNNTDINSINIAEGCAPSGINDAIRELMRQLKEFQTGGAGDSVNSGGDFSVATNKFTVASASGNTAVAGTLAVTGVATLTAQPILSSLTASKAVFTDASKGLVSNDVTGTGNVVMSNSPTLVTPALGTPASGVVTNLTGTASININGTVGATTPSTGAFTTLSSTGNTTLGDASGDTITVNGTTTFVNANPTLSAGTANGVLYLNGSKVATSGSALTFDGTNNFALGSNGSTNVATSITLNATDNAANGSYILGKRNGSSAWLIGDTASSLGSGSGFTSYNYGTAPWIWYLQTGGEQMRLTPTGLGIGTSSPGAKLDVNGSIYAGGAVALSINSSGSNYGQIGYNTGIGDVYWLGYGSSKTGSSTAVLNWNSSGNLGLGVTPSASSACVNMEFGGYGATLSARNTSSAPQFALMSNAVGNWYASTYKIAGKAAMYLVQGNDGSHSWHTAGTGTAGDTITFTQAMTLDASGHLLLGTTSSSGLMFDFSPTTSQKNGINYVQSSPDSYTDIYGCGTAGGWVGAIRFFTSASAAASERARIDSSGNLLVGTTTNIRTSKFVVGGTLGGGTGAEFDNDSSATWIPLAFHTASTLVGYISATTSITTYNSVSDYRLKNVIGNVTDSGARIDALEPVEYEWKENGERTRGFLAHKFQEVYPQSVSGTKDAVDADGNPVYQAMQASTSEVIADLVAEIKSLRARVAQLESN